MLSKNDIATLHGMFGKLLRENNEVFGRELTREVRDEMYSVVNGAVSASEQRMIARIDDSQSAILEATDELVLPRIKKNRRSIIRLNKAIGIA